MATADVPFQPEYLADVERLPTHEREGRLFWKLRLRESRSQLKHLFTHSRMRTSLVISLSIFFWAGLFALFYMGFSFVVSNVGPPGATYHAQTVQFVFTLFFMSLQVMLIFSAGIILYGGLYASNETSLLMTLPVRDSRLVYYRFQEALFFSSWGFFLLASPMMVAYGLVVKAPWYYYAYLPALMISFAYIPCSIGAIACLILISRVPHLRRIIVGAIALVVVAIAYSSIWHTLDIDNADLLGTAWFKQTFQRFEFTRGEWLPSTWLSNGLLDAARRQSDDYNDLPWLDSGKYLVVLVSNALFFHLVLLWIGGLVFRDSYYGLNARQAREAHAGMVWIDRIFEKLMFFLPRETQLLIIKDIRLFRRDPVQWSQFIIFFGLLMLYFANIDRFRQHRADLSIMTWVNIVSFLNLAVVGLILSTFTTRFIYPLISLEGRRFWILGRLPIKRDTILWGKFVFAACGSWFPCAALVLASDILLDVSLLVTLVHQFISVLLCIGLSGMAVGLGAIMPDFHEQSPSKIAAGFGGTLNLVLSAIYILLVVLMTALPCHFYLLTSDADLQSQIGHPRNLQLWVGLGLTGVIILAAVVTIIPLRSGLKAFRELEV
jgi:ABC-2 type transport system permease protein